MLASAPRNVVAIEEVPMERVNRYGVLDIAQDKGRLVSVKGLVEKPPVEVSRQDRPSRLRQAGFHSRDRTSWWAPFSTVTSPSAGSPRKRPRGVRPRTSAPYRGPASR